MVEANTTAGELFNCSPADLVGRHQQELHPPEDMAAYTEAFQRAIDGDRVNRLQNGQPLYIETADGQHIPVEINVQRLNTPTGVFILGVFREVTAQLERERRLEASTSRLETLLDALPVPVAVLDTDATVEGWNQAAETTFGYDFDTVQGKSYPLFIEDDEFDRLFERIFDGGILDGYKTTHRAQDGSRIPVELYAMPVYQNGTFSGIIGTAIEISNRLERAQQLNVLHRVLRHNLRNELNIISGWAEHLADSPSEHQTAIDKIQGATDRLLSLSEEANHIRTNLTNSSKQLDSIPITQALSQLSDQVTDREMVTMSVNDVPDSCAISRRGLWAVSQLLDSVLTHIEESTVELAIETHEQHVTLELVASESLLPVGARRFINTGEETGLEHSDDLVVPKSDLIIESIGGDVTIVAADEATPSNTLTVELPRIDDRS
ncbi:PAS domain-containing sensor histidine kinase [Halorientalis persicus]|uniref:PAS domain-containing sensor histidine kinase n=1 Tax=Halorientalis persicus TaxID=1367881 RepID=UPI001FCD13C6|nr:PAS domain S-box protein [Halorientalis persicus]